MGTPRLVRDIREIFMNLTGRISVFCDATSDINLRSLRIYDYNQDFYEILHKQVRFILLKKKKTVYNEKIKLLKICGLCPQRILRTI